VSARSYVACDLGAESGRVILGTLDGGRVRLEEIHRFPNEPVSLDGSLRWNLPRLFQEILTGLGKVAARGVKVESVSVDSWGVDYAWLGAGQPLLAQPHHYRDPRTESAFKSVTESALADLVFEETGLQFMPINTLYQIPADQQKSPGLVALADRFLPTADYLHFLMSGVAVAERSLASTTQMYNPVTRDWSRPLREALQLPGKIFPPIVASGTRLGPLRENLANETGLGPVEVVATCSHDTGAAVAAVPATGEDWAFLSSGTWSLMGVELNAPLITPQVRARGFTNEAGFANTTRFLKNLVGLWILQESKRDWARQGRHLDYAGLAAAAGDAEPFRSVIDPLDPRFLRPGRMLEKIAAFCRESDQPEPETPGHFARCIYESLALMYARTLGELRELTGRSLRVLHIVGGGSQSELLNQWVADATGCVVMAGPLEATAVGNVLLQAVAMGQLSSAQSLRGIVRHSFEIRRFDPRPEASWQTLAARLDR
jgi:rhamnulokinase